MGSRFRQPAGTFEWLAGYVGSESCLRRLDDRTPYALEQVMSFTRSSRGSSFMIAAGDAFRFNISSKQQAQYE
jgi:hypothetical protein